MTKLASPDQPPFRIQLRPALDHNGLSPMASLKAFNALAKHRIHIPYEILPEISNCNDELVYALAIARGGSAASYHQDKPDAIEFREKVFQNAFDAIKAEGILWSPLLDQLADKLVWKRWVEDSEHTDEPKRITALDQARLLSPWISTRTNAKDLFQLLEFKADEIWETVALETRIFPEELVDKLLTKDRAMSALTQNQHLPANVRAELTHKIFALLDGNRAFTRGGPRHNNDPRSEHRRAIVSALTHLARHEEGLPEEVKEQRIQHFERANGHDRELFEILIADPTLSTEQVARIAAYVKEPEQIVELALRPNVSPAVLDNMIYRASWREEIAQTFLRRSDLPASLVQRVGEAAIQFPSVVLAAIKHPAVPVSLLRHYSKCLTGHRVRVALAQSPKARQDAEIRQKLSRSRSPIIMDLLLTDAPQDEYANLFGRLATLSPETAYWTLKRTPPPEGVKIPRSLLAPIFNLGGKKALDAMVLVAELSDRFIDDPQPSISRKASSPSRRSR